MISKLASSIGLSSTLAITARANALKQQGVDVVGFGAGEPDFDTPDYIKEKAIESILQGFTKYTPVSGILSLRQAISQKLYEENGILYNTDQIVVSNGAKHALTNTFMAILNPGDEVLIPAPFWLSYPEMVKVSGGESKIIYTKKEDNFKLQPDDLEEAITNKSKVLVLNSPSNPTGIVYTEEELRALAEVAVKHQLWIVSDEIYEYLTFGEHKHVSVAALSDEIYKRTITINGLSKSHAMTGWRIGYLAAPVEVASAACNIQSHMTSNPNSIAQKAAEVAMAIEKEFIEEMIRVYEKRSELVYSQLVKIEEFNVIKPQGAFYCFIEMSKLCGKRYKSTIINDASDFAELLLEEENVAVVPCADFGAPMCIRLSYAISDLQIEKGIHRIKMFVNKLK